MLATGISTDIFSELIKVSTFKAVAFGLFMP